MRDGGVLLPLTALVFPATLAALTVTVTDTAGRGVAGATISAEPAGSEGRKVEAISNGDDSSWHNQRLELALGENHVDVSPGRMRVTGSIRLETEPLEATVLLGDRSAGVSASFASDEDGRFEGWLPQLDVEAARWFVRVRAPDPKTAVAFEGVTPEPADSDGAHFALVIPDRSIEGTVVDEKGAAQEAGVTAVHLADANASLRASEPFQTLSDPTTGAFVLRGLVPADYGVLARAYRPSPSEVSPNVLLESEVSIISLDREPSTGSHKGLSLVLRPADVVSGRVHTPDGVGVPDATVFTFPSQSPSNPVRREITDAQGRFSANVPANTSSVMVLIEAVGVGRRATRQATRKGEPLDLVLDPSSSGILVLESDPAVEYGNVFVYHDGALDGLRALERWAQAHGDFGQGQIRAPFMSPGVYRVCVPRSVMEAFQAISTSLPTDQCAEGELRPGGELRLTVPPPPTAP